MDKAQEREEFGSYLRSLRKSRQMTLINLCDISGVSHPYLSQIETGSKGIPSPQLIRKLSVALGCTYIGMMIKAGHLTEDELLTFRKEKGVSD
jgi:transcriptional regulator with XRE-family HTH domain